MPYGFRRWNGGARRGSTRYNRQLDLTRRRFEDGWHVDDHVEDWYRMLTHFDLLAKELGARDCRGR
ncbi:hypothetical protein GXW84_16190 [Rhodococcus sp. IEGM 248]|nr:hypothetical protein [Rhodococcus sp. IEGM 248]